MKWFQIFHSLRLQTKRRKFQIRDFHFYATAIHSLFMIMDGVMVSLVQLPAILTNLSLLVLLFSLFIDGVMVALVELLPACSSVFGVHRWCNGIWIITCTFDWSQPACSFVFIVHRWRDGGIRRQYFLTRFVTWLFATVRTRKDRTPTTWTQTGIPI